MSVRFCLGLCQGVKLVQLGLKQFLVRKSGLVLRDQCGRHGTAEGVFDNLVVLGGAKENADRGLLMRLSHVAVERLQVELQFAVMFGLELDDLELEGDQAIEPRLKKTRSRAKSLPPTWMGY